jgi:hypothetical protein
MRETPRWGRLLFGLGMIALAGAVISSEPLRYFWFVASGVFIGLSTWVDW